MSLGDAAPRRADVVILTAIRLEFDAVLKVDAGAIAGSMWEQEPGPSRLPVAYRSFAAASGRPLRVAVAVAADMGATAATNTLLPLIERLHPRWVAMCGVCAGRRKKVQLGDVVAADRLYYHDTGKELPHEIQRDITTYNLRDDWKAALQAFRAAEHFRDADWLARRPLTSEWRENCALVALHRDTAEPWKAFEPPLKDGEWQAIVAELRKRKLLAPSGRALTDEGRRVVEDLLFDHMGQLPNLSPWGKLLPFQLHVAPIGSGARVIEDEGIWTVISASIRKTLGLEMEAAAIGELAHHQHQHQLHAIVMKGVMDFADDGRDDHFKEFAARAAAECLLWFLRKHVETEVTAGVDDLLSPGRYSLPKGTLPPSVLLNAKYAVVPWHDARRAETLAALDAWADEPSRAVALQLVHGDGGIGKTRLAIEWVHRRRERNDAAGFLMADPPGPWFERLCSLGSPVLIVIDYAESRPDLIKILQRVAAFAAGDGPRRRVRVLLLARNAGDWWAALQRDPAICALGDRRPIELEPLAINAADRAAIFAEAATQFAALKHRGIPAPPQGLNDARFEHVLYVHMAALLAVEEAGPAATATAAAPTQPAALEVSSLIDAILTREERFWIRDAASRFAVVDMRLARQLVAAATLRGGLASEEIARALCERLTGQRLDRNSEELLQLLHDVYGRSKDGRSDDKAYMPGLEPDLLGEGIVVRVAASLDREADPWIHHVLVPNDEAGAVTSAFVVLGRVSGTGAALVRPWMEQLLTRELARNAVLALRVTVQGFGNLDHLDRL